MSQRYFRVVSLCWAFVFVLAISAGLAGNSETDPRGLTITRGSDGSLLASLEGGEDAQVGVSYAKHCPDFFDKDIPCLMFTAVSGTEPLPARGCPHAKHGPPNAVGCSIAGIKALRIVLESGGTATSQENRDECSPVPISIEARGGNDVPYLVTVSDGCPETVSCPGQFGTVTADPSDDVKADCSDNPLKGVTRQSPQ
jgi:hypothetical protein